MKNLTPISSAPRVQKTRQRMRQRGLSAIQLWVPDTRTAQFQAECRRQTINVAVHAQAENEMMDWVEGVADTTGWEA